ncbi:hypothetical protein COO91_06890 [Nostoc flagelliforme CCNUN1]|uniref:Uncharacterized protein n=1 Tax=Nostoc flagelliforme CCNUN1 TaxID=2038116 RepID=A0A2K8SZI8_9NOSO|nr:hypothetical protein COO91_06890 [Nostoc flagelliforme CCNUN1]
MLFLPAASNIARPNLSRRILGGNNLICKVGWNFELTKLLL